MVKRFVLLLILLSLSACSTVPQDTSEPVEAFPERTQETVRKKPEAVPGVKDADAKAAVLTDHLLHYVMTPDWLEETFVCTEENIFRFLVSLPIFQENTEHPYGTYVTLSDDGWYYHIALADMKNIVREVFGLENWSPTAYTDELWDEDLQSYRIASETSVWYSAFSAEDMTVSTENDLVFVDCDIVSSKRYESADTEYGKWRFIYEYTDGFLTFRKICPIESSSLIFRDLIGQPIEPLLLNAMNGSAAYDGDISTDGIFSAEWDLTAPEGERLISYTGKPELYNLELFSDHITLISSGSPWDMYITDDTMSELLGDAFAQYTADGTVTVNDFMRFRVTSQNGDVIPLTVVGLEQGGGHFSVSMFYFDRTITEEAVTFSMEQYLPEGTEPEQYPRLYPYSKEYLLWEASDDRPEQIEDISMTVEFRRDSGYDFRITEADGCAEWFDAKLYNTSLYLTTDAELSGELYELLKSCNHTEWEDIVQYDAEVRRKMLFDVLKLKLSTQGRSTRILPDFVLQENTDGTTTLILVNISYDTMVSGTLEIHLP